MEFKKDTLKRTWVIFKQSFIGMTLGIIIALLISVYANSIPSTNVSYSHSLTSQTTVKGTLDEIINKTHNCKNPDGCPNGYICKLPTCKRVTDTTTLHTEPCTQTSNYCSATRGKGATITYGTHKALGTTLETGDAFDCDVMGDGSYEYEGKTARFYYVSTMKNGHSYTDSSIAVLIYYTNVLNGHNSTSAAVYAGPSDTVETAIRDYGPITAAKHLPGGSLAGTTEWPGVSLKYQIRTPTTEGGGTLSNTITYPTSRLLTYQEVDSGCKSGSTAITTPGGLDEKCTFLFENTKFSTDTNPASGIWLENRYNNTGWQAAFAQSINRYIGGATVSYGTTLGVRPAIEVPLYGLGL